MALLYFYFMSFWSTLGKIGQTIAPFASSALNTILGGQSASKQNKQMMQFQQHMADQQYARQRQLTIDTPLLQKQGLENAGMSPSALGGYSGAAASIASVPSTPSQQPVYKDLDFDSLFHSLLLPSQIKQAKANADLAQSNADMAKLKVNEEKDKQDAFLKASQRSYVVDPSTGQNIYTDDPNFNNFVDSFKSKYGYEPTLEVENGRLSLAAVNASKVFSDLSAAIARNDADKITSKFTQTLTELKLKDRDVMTALYQLDAKQFDFLSEQIKKIGSDIEVNDTIKALNKAKTRQARQEILESIARKTLLGTQNKLLNAQLDQVKNSNIGSLFDSILNGKTFGDKLVALGKLILTALVGSQGGALGAVGNLIKH